MTKTTEKILRATTNIIPKACLYTTAIEGGKLYIEKEKEAYKKGGKFRKGLAITNIAIMAIGIYQAIKYGQEVSDNFAQEIEQIYEEGDNSNIVNF